MDSELNERTTMYTEDKIPIYTVYVGGLPHQANENNLLHQFSAYGPIESVKIFSKNDTFRQHLYFHKKRPKFRFAFITFKETKYATKAIKSKFLFYEGRKLLIKPADSWKQPITKKSQHQDFENSTIQANSLLNLNDDCLLHLYSYLSIYDQFKLSQLCTRLDDIFQVKFRSNKCLDFDEMEKMTLMESRELLIKCKPNLKSLKYYGTTLMKTHRRLFKFIPSMSLDLESLELKYVTVIQTDIYKSLFQNMKNLKTLVLSNSQMTDEICSAFVNCENLEKLDLSENYNLTGQHLCKLKNLIDLDLNHCANLQSKHFISITKSCLKLKKLNINRCDRLNEFTFNALVENLKNLEDLRMTNDYQSDKIEKLTELENLKRLEVHCPRIPKDRFFIDLVKNKSTTLDRLDIIGGQLNNYCKDKLCEMKNLKYLGVPLDTEIDDTFLKNIANNNKSLTHINCAGCLKITKDGIMYLIKNCQSISCFDLSSCNQFSCDLIVDAIEKLKLTPNRQCKFIIGNTGITKELLEEHSGYMANKHLVPISYEISHTQFFIDDDYDSMSDDDDIIDFVNYFYDEYDEDDDDDDDLDYDAFDISGDDEDGMDRWCAWGMYNYY